MKIKLICFLCTCLLFINPSFANALSLENTDNPISFTVKILPWDQADKVLPKKSIFTIMDIETGLSFEVQRRAGSRHADVQPLTYEDTKIMKQIYNGKWSWKRRAILIIAKDQFLAASMHGMPHGAGALKNGFPGHFCVHFYGSTTQGSGSEDLSHKIMILRAGGRLEDYLNEISPIEVINVFETAVNQQDYKTIRLLMQNHVNELQQRLKNIMFISYNRKTLLVEGKDNPLFQRLTFDGTIYYTNYKKEKKRFELVLSRDLKSGQWKIANNLARQL